MTQTSDSREVNLKGIIKQMVYLKAANLEDVEKEYDFIRQLPEDEIYMSVHKDNPASLKVQLKNGAYIHHEDEKEFYTRVKRGLKYVCSSCK